MQLGPHARFTTSAQSSSLSNAVTNTAEIERSRFSSRPDLAAYIDSLASSKTEAAMETLLQIALDPSVPERHATNAAAAFSFPNRGSLQLTRLLDSPHTNAWEVALVWLIGARIDRSTWEQKLVPLLGRGSLRLKELIIVIAQEDSGEVPPQEKAAALLKGMDGIESLPESNRRAGYDDWTGPCYQLVYRYLANALAQMDGLDLGALRELTPQRPSAARDCVLIARFSKGDLTVREELSQIALNHSHYLLKARAVQAFLVAGTRQDIPLLEKIAQADTTVVTNKYLPPVHWLEVSGHRNYYPLREGARDAITNILRRTQSK